MEQDAVMPSLGDSDEVVVPKDAARMAESREMLGELPVAPAQVDVQGDADMENVDEVGEDAGDDLFG